MVAFLPLGATTALQPRWGGSLSLAASELAVKIGTTLTPIELSLLLLFNSAWQGRLSCRYFQHLNYFTYISNTALRTAVKKSNVFT